MYCFYYFLLLLQTAKDKKRGKNSSKAGRSRESLKKSWWATFRMPVRVSLVKINMPGTVFFIIIRPKKVA